VYDLGVDTFDATLIRRSGDGFDVAGTIGLPDRVRRWDSSGDHDWYRL
jgi:hypothetical protein